VKQTSRDAQIFQTAQTAQMAQMAQADQASVKQMDDPDQPLGSEALVFLEYEFFRDRPFLAAKKLKAHFDSHPACLVFFPISVGRMCLEKEALIQDFREAGLKNQEKRISVFAHSAVFRSRVLGEVGLSHQVLGFSAALFNPASLNGDSEGGCSPVLQLGVIFRLGDATGCMGRVENYLAQRVSGSGSGDSIILHTPQQNVPVFPVYLAALVEEQGVFPLEPLYPEPSIWVRILRSIFSLGEWEEKMRKVFRRSRNVPRLRNFLVKAYRFSRRLVG